ncbi:hypothetical protein EVAR_43643_1 [Eumeta japonica]|uniref:Uncharacterized protein n=1 Tax=Eumeta variegata TaxID=151549 RepID=A0A4C1ZIK9_EUMVA|nr:hypothetical protein EVAR_43643_1 [Eumeta japonica]
MSIFTGRGTGSISISVHWDTLSLQLAFSTSIVHVPGSWTVRVRIINVDLFPTVDFGPKPPVYNTGPLLFGSWSRYRPPSRVL